MKHKGNHNRSKGFKSTKFALIYINFSSGNAIRNRISPVQKITFEDQEQMTSDDDCSPPNARMYNT